MRDLTTNTRKITSQPLFWDDSTPVWQSTVLVPLPFVRFHLLSPSDRILGHALRARRPWPTCMSPSPPSNRYGADRTRGNWMKAGPLEHGIIAPTPGPKRTYLFVTGARTGSTCQTCRPEQRRGYNKLVAPVTGNGKWNPSVMTVSGPLRSRATLPRSYLRTSALVAPVPCSPVNGRTGFDGAGLSGCCLHCRGIGGRARLPDLVLATGHVA